MKRNLTFETAKKMLVLEGKKKAPWYLSGGLTAADVVGVYYASGAASKEASLLSLVGSNNLVENGTVSWDATGWYDFSDANYLNGTFSLSTNYSYVIRWTMANVPPDYGRAFEVGAISSEPLCVLPYCTDNKMYIVNNSIIWSRARQNAGVVVVTPTHALFNGADLGAGSASGTSAYTGTTWKIGRGHSGGGGFNGRIQALAIYNKDITEAQAVAVSTAMASLP